MSITKKKLFKITLLTSLLLIIAVVGYYLYRTNLGSRDILLIAPREPQNEIPITYNVGWWNHQQTLSVDSFTIDIVESKLNLFNIKSLISYKVSGRLTYKEYWRPGIVQVHLSERINHDTTLACDRIIEITPVIAVKENSNVKGGVDKFEFKNEHTIISNHWGANRIKFICGQKQQTIVLQQYK